MFPSNDNYFQAYQAIPQKQSFPNMNIILKLLQKRGPVEDIKIIFITL